MRKVMKIGLALLMSLTGATGLFACSPSGPETSSSQASHVHTFAEGTFPCQERKCLECGLTIPPSAEHDNELRRTVSPTCLNKGYSVYACKNCGTISQGDFVSPLGHDYQKATELAPTCSSVGYTEYVCSRCEDSYKQYLPSLEHHFQEGSAVVTPPTCTHYGTTSEHCSTCGQDFITEYTAPLGHVATPGKDKVIAPTCTREGRTEHLCSTCGETYSDSYQPKLDHSFLVTAIEDATCAHASYLEKTCTSCGLVRIEGGEEQKKDHSFQEDGVCSACHKSFREANFLRFRKNGKAIPCLDSDSYEHLIYSQSGEETIDVSISPSDMSYLLSKNVSRMTLLGGSQDGAARGYEFQGKGNRVSAVARGSSQGFDFERTSAFRLDFLDSEGAPLSSLGEEGISFAMTLTSKEEDGSVLDEFPLRCYFSTSYSESDPSSYLAEPSTGESAIEYVEGKGYRLDYLKEDNLNSFAVYIRPEIMRAKMEEGYTSLTLTFAPNFEGESYAGSSLECAYDIFAYQAENGENAERVRVASQWICGGTPAGDGFSHVLENLNQYDFSENGLEMNFSSCGWNDPSKFVGHIFLGNLAFGGKASV